ncbi:toll/interleukin-1 receptor domain-containing protein [Streptomyces sp. NPDC046685]|uniref:toll/interleukin-1 receptor domain-containing protein n=1 Tax=Streptomyces sp. NPDC046685 TaxID=3157202 RepID=UPI0033F14417
MDVSTTGQANRIFISYAHLDDELLNQAVAHFTNDLESFYAAQTGGELEVFFDRDSIGWGSDWRKRIDSELRGASIFMPIITMQYFNRPACREELNAFYGSADLLGTGFLILPVVVMGASRITANHPMPEVRLIESIQFENLEDAFMAGRGSPEWRRALALVADKLGVIITQAEEKLGGQKGSTASEIDRAEPDEHFDFFEHVELLNEIGDRLPSEMQSAEHDLIQWCTIVQEEMQQFAATSPNAMRARSISMAQAVQDPSLSLQGSASALAASVSQADALMRSMVGELNGVHTKEASDLANGLISSLTSDSTDLRELSDGLVEILGMLKTMELLSVPLRKSIKPGRVGFAKIQDVVTTIGGWGNIPTS